jgi:hypothetical protein
MSVEDSEVTDVKPWHDIEILNALMTVFHVIALTHVLGDRTVEPLHNELELPDSKGIVRL